MNPNLKGKLARIVVNSGPFPKEIIKESMLKQIQMNNNSIRAH
jgi:hypothetical protein